jgi:small-conductance mechanosensitive channel
VNGQAAGEQPGPEHTRPENGEVAGPGEVGQGGTARAETGHVQGEHVGEAQGEEIAVVAGVEEAAVAGGASGVGGSADPATGAGTGSGSGETSGREAGTGISAAGVATAKQAVAAQAGVKQAMAERSGSGSRIHQIEPDEHSPLAALTNAISADFRRALLASALACAGLGLTYVSGGVLSNAPARVDFFTKHAGLGQAAAIFGAVVFLIFGVVAVRSATREVLKTVPPSVGDNRRNGLRWVCLLVGYLFVIFGTLGALNVPIERLLVGGAVTGVILGIAAQQSLGNLFAGLMLLLTRPFAIGDEVSLRSGQLGGPLTGLVADMNLTYVKLVTDHGTLLVPNSALLSAVVGPAGVFDT